MIPDPFRAKGLIDTAAGASCINPAVIDRLLLDPLEQARLRTASGDIRTAGYHVTLTLGWTEHQPPDPIPVRVYVAEIAGADALVGLDVLRQGEFTLYGRIGRFALTLPRRGAQL